MKKTILFLVAVIGIGIAAQAQDIITLKNGEDIQALVQEINDDNIKYKKFDNPNGPNYTLKKSEIFMIRYKNGSKDVFPTESTATSSKSEQKPSVNDLRTEFHRIGRNDIEMLDFFETNNYMKHYNDFKSANNRGKVGGGIFGAGLGLLIVGVIVVPLADDEIVATLGSYYIVGGCVLSIVGIPIMATAGGAKRRIKNDFERTYLNNDYSLRQQPTLNFGFTSRGLGVALKF